MNSFKIALQKKVDASSRNNYSKGNYDEYRFGPYPSNGGVQRIKSKLKNILGYNPTTYLDVSVSKIIVEYGDKLQDFYELLNDKSKSLLVDLVAFKLLGYRKVKLPLNNSYYWKVLDKVKHIKSSNDFIDPNFIHIKLERFDLKAIGYNIEMYMNDFGVAVDYVFEQYAYKCDNRVVVGAEKDDVVLDIGGCWGDTALYFAEKIGSKGRVFSFEFIPNNVRIFEINTQLNKELQARIKLIQNPVSNASGKQIFYKDNGPGSFISDNPIEGMEYKIVSSISIDDYVHENSLAKVDFIKMDIEGSEPFALEGAVRTIRKFRPKLAIAIYHSMSDFVNIQEWIKNLELEYDFYLGHYTIHDEETILFAKPRN
jgi:FkbM family methyltransferase